MRAGTAKEIKFESIDSLFGIPKESEQHITTMGSVGRIISIRTAPISCA